MGVNVADLFEIPGGHLFDAVVRRLTGLQSLGLNPEEWVVAGERVCQRQESGDVSAQAVDAKQGSSRSTGAQSASEGKVAFAARGFFAAGGGGGAASFLRTRNCTCF